MKNKTSLFNNVLLIIGAIVLALLMHSFGFENIAENIRKVGPWFALLILVWGVVYLLNAFSFYRVIKDESPESKNVSFSKIFQLTVSGFAINVSNPVGLAGGEPYRIFQLKPLIGTAKATSGVILYNMMHFLSHFTIWLCTIPLIALTLNIRIGLFYGLWIGFSVLIVLTFFFFLGYQKGMAVRTIRFLSKMPLIGGRMRNILINHFDQLEAIDANICSLYVDRPRAFWMSLLYDWLSRVVSCLEIYVIMMTLGHQVDFTGAVIIYSLSTLIANILFFSPMQLGTREGGYIAAMSAIGIAEPGIGIFISLITRVREFVWIGIGLVLMKIKIK